MREADLYEDVMKKPQGVATAASELSGGPLQKVVDLGWTQNMCSGNIHVALCDRGYTEIPWLKPMEHNRFEIKIKTANMKMYLRIAVNGHRNSQIPRLWLKIHLVTCSTKLKARCYKRKWQWFSGFISPLLGISTGIWEATHWESKMARANIVHPH